MEKNRTRIKRNNDLNVLSATEIYNSLNDFGIVGQDEYKKALAEFGYRHLLRASLQEKGETIDKINLCVAGPSGSAKTMGLEALAKIIGVDFFLVDGANISQSGYRGNTNVDSIIADLYKSCGSDKARTQRAIVMVDEFDKIIDKYQMKITGATTGTQNNFLKLLEGSENYNCKADGTSDATCLTIDTRGISFALTGTFGYFDVEEENNHRSGFIKDEGNHFELTPEYLIKFGFTPELVGRLNLFVKLNILTKNDYLQIINSKKGIIEQQKKILSYENVDLSLTEAAKELMAEQAAESHIGARKLKQLVSTVCSSMIFDVQSNPEVTDVIIDAKDGQLVRNMKSDKKKLKQRSKGSLHTWKKLSVETSCAEMHEMLEDITNDIQTRYENHLYELCEDKDTDAIRTIKGYIHKGETRNYVKYVLDTFDDECDLNENEIDRHTMIPSSLDFIKHLLITVRQNVKMNSSMGVIYYQSVIDLKNSLMKEVVNNELLH